MRSLERGRETLATSFSNIGMMLLLVETMTMIRSGAEYSPRGLADVADAALANSPEENAQH